MIVLAVPNRDRPYRPEHDASVAAKAGERRAIPNLSGLLRWFAKQWTDEVPTDIHSVGIEWERPGTIIRGDLTTEKDPGGGNALGAPRLDPGFRAHVYGSAFRTEHPSSDFTPEVGESYATPLRATITWMERNRHPVWAAWLRILGRSGGDLGAVQSTATIRCEVCKHPNKLDIEYVEAITTHLLGYAWTWFREDPKPRAYDKSEDVA